MYTTIHAWYCNFGFSIHNIVTCQVAIQEKTIELLILILMFLDTPPFPGKSFYGGMQQQLVTLNPDMKSETKVIKFYIMYIFR